MKSRRFLLILLILFLGVGAKAQTPTTQGKEFWVSYMRNGHRDSANDRLTLIVSGKHNCSGRVYNPNTHWETFFQVIADSVLIFTIPDAQGYNSQQEGVANTGLYVTSEDTISLYIGNEAANSYDAANVLPVSTLGTNYLIQCHQSIGEASGHTGNNRSSFLVIATEDDTSVEITPSIETHGNHLPGQSYTVQLNEGECYHVMNKNAGNANSHEGDLSGTTIVASKPVAVFNGNCLTCVPSTWNQGFDHVFDQAIPVDYWGRRFVVTSTCTPANMSLKEDLVKVTALSDGTTVTRDGQPLFSLNAGESASFDMDLTQEPCTYLEANLPVAVFLYQHSHNSGNPAYGDPSMVWISPVEQTIYEVTFSTFQVQEVQNHFVNIVCPTENIADLTFDGQSIALNFQTVPGAPEYSYTRYEVIHGVHTIRCNGGLIAHVYGIGQAEGYAYSVGSSAKQLTKQLYVDDELSTGTYATCQDETLRFRVETNYEFHHVKWTFGDGQEASSASEMTHVYAEDGNFALQAVVYRELNEPFDTLATTILVHPKYASQLSVTTCADNYPFLGSNYNVPGTYTVAQSTVMGCDSIIELVLTAGEEIPYETTKVVCEACQWFGSIYTESGRYEHRVEDVTPEGCDSLYILYLTVGYPPEHPERYYESCEGCWWQNQWCEETGSYYKSFVTPEGCVYDSVFHFTLLDKILQVTDTAVCQAFEWHGHEYDQPGHYEETMSGLGPCEMHVLSLDVFAPPAFESIEGMEYVAMANSFWPGRYDYHLDDSTGMITDSIHWELMDNPGWLLEPRGASCSVVATTMDEVVLHAWTTENPLCEKDAFFTIRCRGFGVEENSEDGLELYPNPAKDELVVKGKEMIRIIIYDLAGHQLIRRSCQGETQVSIDLSELAPAMYLAEVQTKKGNKTRCFAVIL